MPTQLNPRFYDYLNNLQIKQHSRNNYRQYVRWIERYGSGKVDLQTMKAKADIEHFLDGLATRYDADHPGQKLFNNYRRTDTRCIIQHYLKFLRSEGIEAPEQVLEWKDANENKERRNPNWNRDELILALELYLRNPKSPAGKGSTEVRKLSEELNQLQRILGGEKLPKLRNVNSVYLKMMNFRRFDPQFISQGKKGMTHGSALESTIWNEFSGDNERLARTCSAIREGLKECSLESLDGDDIEETGIVEATEGRLLTRIHRRRERSRRLVDAKKKQTASRHGALACEVCSFDFSKRYGPRGEGFIECHHTKPVTEYGDGRKTTIEELALVCANCHRMIHSRRPWLTVEELRLMLR